MRTRVGAAFLTVLIATGGAAFGQSAAPSDESLLKARTLVWTAYFSNDQHALRELLPGNLVAGGSDSSWETRDDILRDAAAFAADHGKLQNLTFAHVHIQHFSEATVIYSDYELAGERSGQPFKQAGKAMEVFVFEHGRWVNAGWQLAALR